MLVGCCSLLPSVLWGQLDWGADGNGGTGTWDTTTADWWNGSGPVAWQAGGDAIFNGNGAAITSVYPGPVAGNLTFNTPGYSITGGWITGGTNGLTITTNADATIGSVLSSGGGSSLNQLVKAGAGTLTITGTNFLSSVMVNAGEYKVAGSSTLFFSSVTLADVAGTKVTLAQSASGTDIAGLSGGGLNGGLVQPSSDARTVTLTIWPSYSSTTTYSGVLADNGPGILALKTFGGNASLGQTLAGLNTYSGSTEVSASRLIFAGNGSALNTASVMVDGGGVLSLDDSAALVGDRLPNSAGVSISGSTLQLVGNASTPVTEHLGSLLAIGAVTLNVVQPGIAATTLDFASYTRENHTTLNFPGNGTVTIAGQNFANTNGIVGAYAVAGNDWAAVGPGGAIGAFAGYVTNRTVALATDNVLLQSQAVSTNLTGSPTWYSLNLENNLAATSTVSLATGSTLTLNSGGLLSSGVSPAVLQGGTLAAGAGGEWVITNYNALTIASVIADGSMPATLVKSGAGTLTLSAANTYTGGTVVNQGVLTIGSDNNLGAGGALTLNSGTLRLSANLSSARSFGLSAGQSGTIDTNGHSATISALTIESLTKTGAGSPRPKPISPASSTSTTNGGRTAPLATTPIQ